jgi:hypothetical protein
MNAAAASPNKQTRWHYAGVLRIQSAVLKNDSRNPASQRLIDPDLTERLVHARKPLIAFPDADCEQHVAHAFTTPLSCGSWRLVTAGPGAGFP